MAAIMFTFKNSDKKMISHDESVEKRSICLNITQTKSHLNFGKNLLEAKVKT